MMKRTATLILGAFTLSFVIYSYGKIKTSAMEPLDLDHSIYEANVLVEDYNLQNNSRSIEEKNYIEEQLKSNLEFIEKKLNIQEVNYEWSRDLEYGNVPNKIIIHHTASPSATAEIINEDHINKGWAGIGYHFFIKKDGTIYRGRPEDSIGAHSKGSNLNTLGICLEGDFEEKKPTNEQLKSIINLSVYLGVKYNTNEIIKHGDVYETCCPGSKFPFEKVKNSIIDEIKSLRISAQWANINH